VHHIIPRSKGGPTRLDNLMLLCSFHHLIAVHRWGWTIVLHGDGTVTARSPDGVKTLHSHAAPPGHDPAGNDPPDHDSPVTIGSTRVRQTTRSAHHEGPPDKVTAGLPRSSAKR
jgi:hypothetical protein